MLKRLLQRVKDAWASVDAKITKWGTGENQKPNLLGWLWSAIKFAVAAPVAIALTTVKIIKLMVLNPTEGINEVRYQAWRMMRALGGIVGVYKVVENPGTKWQHVRWEYKRAVAAGYVWLFSSLFIDPLIQVGMMKTAAFLAVAAPGALILSGIGIAIARWKASNRELHAAIAMRNRQDQQLVGAAETTEVVDSLKATTRDLRGIIADAPERKALAHAAVEAAGPVTVAAEQRAGALNARADSEFPAVTKALVDEVVETSVKALEDKRAEAATKALVLNEEVVTQNITDEMVAEAIEQGNRALKAKQAAEAAKRAAEATVLEAEVVDEGTRLANERIAAAIAMVAVAAGEEVTLTPEQILELVRQSGAWSSRKKED